MPIPQKIENLLAKIDEFSAFGCAVGIRFLGGTPEHTHFSYSKDFLEAYVDHDLAKVDTTLQYGMNHDGVVKWCDLESMAEDPRAFQVARRHGIEDGVCIAVTVEGRKTIASISHREDSPLLPEQIDQVRDLLILASHAAWCQSVEPNCSANTKDWLIAAGLGLKDNEIAARLDLSIHGARARKRASLLEIGANTPAEAIRTALGSGQLSEYEIV